MKRITLGHKLALISTGCTVFCVFLASYFINVQTKHLLLSETDKFVQVTLQNTHNLIEHRLKGIQQNSQIIASNDTFHEALQDANYSKLQSQLNTLAVTFPEVYYLAVLDLDKQVVAVNSVDFYTNQLTPRELVGADLSSMSMSPEFHAQLPAMGEPGRDPNFDALSIYDHRKSLWFSAPIMDNESEETLGWVLLAYRFEESIGSELEQIVRRLQSYDYPIISAHLVDEEGHHLNEAHDGKHHGFEQVRDLYLGGQKLQLAFNFDIQKLTKPLRRQTFIMLTAVIPLVLIIVAGILWGSNRLVLKRLKNLHEGVQAFGQGKFDHRITDRGDDEITELATTFNGMGEALGRYKAEMETLVSERTEEAEETSRFLSNVLDHAAEAIITIDENGMIQSFNHTAEDIFGYTFEEVKGQRIASLLPQRTSDQQDDIITQYIRTQKGAFKQASRQELLALRKSGEVFSIELSVSEVSSPKGCFYTGLIRDVSEKKQVEKEIAESKKQLELVVDSTAVGIWDWKVQEGTVQFNRRWAEIVGYELEELEPCSIETWSSLAHPDDLEESGRLLEENWAGKSDYYVCEARMKHKAGHWVWVLDTGRVVEWGEQGEPLRMVGTHLDITERKKAEQELIRFSRIANQTDSAVLVTDAEGKVEWSNPSFSQISGQTLDEVKGCRLEEVFRDASSAEEPFYQMTQSIQQQQAFHIELKHLDANGKAIWLDLRSSPLMDEQDQLQGFVVFAVDISQQKEAEAKLARQQQLLEQMSLQGRIGAWEYDLETEHIYWSNMTKYIHEVQENYQPKLETAINFYKEGEHRERIQQVIEHAIETGEPWNEECQLVTAQGREIWVQAIGRAEFKDGKCVRLFGSFQDIDRRIKAQKELAEAKDQAEQAAIAKSSFLASMSHEIRTPMNGVLGMLSLIEKSPLNSEQLHHVRLAKSSGESLLVLINDILDFSKVEAGKLDLEILDFDLPAMLGEFSESIAQKAQEKGIELILDVTEITHSRVKGDPGRIRQILTNLVGNAIKFTDRGEIVIRAGLVSLENERFRLEVNVQDTGIGIPADRASALFTSFTQLDASTTRKYGGSGLGLAISKQLCELMNGTIQVESEPEQGSCFSFNIELAASDASETIIPAVPIDGHEILVVDDNQTSSEILQKQLSLWGANVTVVEDAVSALELLEARNRAPDQASFDVAFVDYHMPFVDGAEFGRRVRANPDYDDLKLILMTAISNRGDARFFAKLGYQAYFPKPTTMSNLFNALSVVLEGGEALAEADPLVNQHYLAELKDKERSPLPAVPENTASSSDQGPVTGEARLDALTAYQWPEKTRLLLIEDNYINQAVAQGILEKMGLHCDIAGNGVEAIAALHQAPDNAPYTLLLMDCQMPEMDGYQATQEIRHGAAGERFKDITIVAMTANAMKGDREKCLAAGMNDYLSKPIEATKLKEMLVKWLSG